MILKLDGNFALTKAYFEDLATVCSAAIYHCVIPARSVIKSNE